MSRRSFLKWAILLTIILRIAWIAYVPRETLHNHIHRDAVTESDLINIHAVDLSDGRGIVNENGSPSGRRPPGYIFFLAFFYKIFGYHFWIALVIQILLAAATLVVLHRVLESLGIRWVQNLATLLFAVYPPAIISTNVLLDEYLFIPLWLWGVDLFLRRPEMAWKRILAVGFIWGLATFVRTTSIVMPVVLAMVGLICFKRRFLWLVKCFVLLVVIYAVNFPWAVRNYMAWKKPIYFTATGGYSYSVFNPLAKGHISQVPGPNSPYYSPAFAQAKNEGESHLIGMHLAKKWMRENPLDFLNLTIQKALWLMSPDDYEWALNLSLDPAHLKRKEIPSHVEHFIAEIERLWYTVMLYAFLFLTLCTLLPKKVREVWKLPGLTLFLTVLAILGGYAVLYAFAKYRFPVEPLMIGLSLYFFDHLAGCFTFSDKNRKLPHVQTTSS